MKLTISCSLSRALSSILAHHDMCASLGLVSFRSVNVTHRTSCHGAIIKHADGWSIVYVYARLLQSFRAHRLAGILETPFPHRNWCKLVKMRPS